MQRRNCNFVGGFWKAIACFVSCYVSARGLHIFGEVLVSSRLEILQAVIRRKCGRKRLSRTFSPFAVATELLQQDQRAWTKGPGPTGYLRRIFFLGRVFYASTFFLAVSSVFVSIALIA